MLTTQIHKESQRVKEKERETCLHIIDIQIQGETFLADTNANIKEKTGLNWRLE